ncbi:probable 3',5'-cyclic phosphodiesterase pde-5 isoform X2 [Stegodyphus dumicola]|uniref:probable 3',5'-cyclic phosphodiesterase pde-5 isoform X2 n=1 Tax=Stegodyphus dumicola TaxID=202533 RepID=UPI0015ADFFE2|nr:probable 3',5'-cyclic phosphodiesterase pde-5 isoform X2 [Stegodyphus dumicola]
MSKPKVSLRRLPPLLSVSPVGLRYAPSRYMSPSPNQSSSKYHKNCCEPSRYPSPGPGGYLDVMPRRTQSRSSRMSKTAKNNERSQTFGWPQKVAEYLKKHEDFLEKYVLDNVSLELLERWIIRKTQRQRKRAAQMSENNEKMPSLARWKFCVHADKREMLQELTSTLFTYPNKGHVLSELARTIASAVNATGWRLYIYNPETEELCYFGNDQESKNGLQPESSLATYVMKTKESIRWKSADKDARLPGGISFDYEKPINVLCHPILQPDGEISGVLELYKEDSNAEFHEEDEEIVNSYLVWGGIALHYAELYCTMVKQRELNMFLLTVVKSIFHDMVSMDTVILKIMMFARKLVSADRASLFLVDGRSSELYARIFDVNGSEAESEYPSEKKDSDLCPEEIRFPIGKGIAGYVAMTGESLNIPDAYNDARFNRSVDQRTGYNTRNLLCMPIFIRGNVIGVVQMVNKVNGPFTKSDEEAFATFAIYCGLALHHAKLYDKIRRSEQKHKVALEILSYHNTCSEEEMNAIRDIKLPIDKADLKEFNFNHAVLNSDEKVFTSIFMLTDLPKVGSFANIDLDSLVRFTLTVRKNYRRVPYHNWMHGFMVANSVYVVIKKSEVFRPLEELALYVACLCHDLDHRGKTNQFLVHSASPLAAIYSTSVLEHHHFNMTVSILQQDGHNILRNLSSMEYKKVLNNIKHCILATDLALFFPNKAKLAELVEAKRFDWKSGEHRLLLEALTMTACDLCASTKSWELQKEIVKVIFEEFYDQGDVEKSQGRQPIPIMDRTKSDEQPASQVGFLKGICIPCYELLYALIPETKPMLDGCRANLEIWETLAQKQEEKNSAQQNGTGIQDPDNSENNT